ncbi:hypothetical protein [Agrococcus sp. UYP10]|uniref:hypothetical protein n=1 Tax=Agrococcus sp. UYP10 TaxID=1756355 RepID=UPI0033931589
MQETTTAHDLAHELGHTDAGRAIRVFLRNPDDGRGLFDGHRIWAPWRLTQEQAERVRERFS